MSHVLILFGNVLALSLWSPALLFVRYFDFFLLVGFLHRLSFFLFGILQCLQFHYLLFIAGRNLFEFVYFFITKPIQYNNDHIKNN